eukprot:scaffold120735_cov45-Attheya_sp.AAC.1
MTTTTRMDFSSHSSTGIGRCSLLSPLLKDERAERQKTAHAAAVIDDCAAAAAEPNSLRYVASLARG